ncbi:hypothetical protein [Kordia jejudonensis]|uniref:hypothetical protein n=1 Tax=Kordia jejudonensis TaxID=1348245 RepID=UPI0006293794|nr:hypothetical protein [Kordia jejudonensis]
MDFEIKNGLGKIKIGVNGDSFTFIRPLTFCWYDNQGSIGKFLCSLPYSKEYRNEIHTVITSNLNTDFSQNIEGLHELLLPLFKLFPNGEYVLSFHNSEDKDLFKYKSSYDNFTKTHLSDWELHFGNLTVAKDEKKRIKEHQDFLTKNAITKEFYPSNILDYSTYNFYSGSDTFFLATQPKEEIDIERVKYFENEISNGARPFVITYNCFYPDIRLNDDGSKTDHSIHSDYFVLDGHHKLLAYKNLKIYPPIASLIFLPKNKSEILFDLDDLKNYVYSWQLNHIKKYCE